jgi:hypothetical protein
LGERVLGVRETYIAQGVREICRDISHSNV